MYFINEFQEDTNYIKQVCDEWLGSTTRSDIITFKKYYNGRNVTIENVSKKIVLKNKDGHFEERVNPFVSNNKISSNFVQDMIDQKVFTLLDKSPKIDGIEEDTIKKIANKIDYSMQNLAIESAICGYGFAYVYLDKPFNFKVFKTEQCIPFYDKYTEELQALIRFWRVDDETTIHEVYYNGYLKVYECIKDKMQLIEQKPFIQIIQGNEYQEESIDSTWNTGFPVIELKNNIDRKSDFTKSQRSKIDAIDVVMSDFANNLADFQDVYWVIKGLDMHTASEMGAFMEAIKNTNNVKVPEGVDVDTHTISIPHDSKMAFVEAMKKQLLNEMGAIDTELILGGNLTATAIKTATHKLMLRVSKFEYEVYQAMMKMIYFAKESINDNSSVDEILITFRKASISNDTEIITNLMTSSTMLSQRTLLENHPYVENVDEELERIEEEQSSMFTIQPKQDEVVKEDESVIDEDVEV